MIMYIGGLGSGEYIKVKFDMSKNMYQMQFLELLVLILVGQINMICKGLIIDGMFVYLINLLMFEQNCCVFVLQLGKMVDNSYVIVVNL